MAWHASSVPSRQSVVEFCAFMTCGITPQEGTGIAAAICCAANFVDGAHIVRCVEYQFVEYDRIVSFNREPETRRFFVRKFESQVGAAVDDRIVAYGQYVQVAGVGTCLISSVVDPKVDRKFNSTDVAFKNSGATAVEYLP